MIDEVKYTSRTYASGSEGKTNSQAVASTKDSAQVKCAPFDNRRRVEDETNMGSRLGCGPKNEHDQSTIDKLVDLIGGVIEKLTKLVDSFATLFKNQNSCTPQTSASNTSGQTGSTTSPTQTGTSTTTPSTSTSTTSPAAGSTSASNASGTTNTNTAANSTTTNNTTSNSGTSATQNISQTSGTSGSQASSGTEAAKKTTHIRKTGEFLWKPKSDKDGKLAVLLPHQLTDARVKNVELIDAKTGKVIEKGKFAGVGNGDRSHYRFSKEGGSYPDGVLVRVSMEDGSFRRINIKETSQRFTY